jgi:predicted transcriptional regulator
LTKKIEQIRVRVTQLETFNKLNKRSFDLPKKELLDLPKHLQRTFIQLEKLGSASAPAIAEHTKLARAVESSYLNQLVMIGYASKNRQGRTVIFTTKLVTIKQG